MTTVIATNMNGRHNRTITLGTKSSVERVRRQWRDRVAKWKLTGIHERDDRS